jgi:hypothetical protein
LYSLSSGLGRWYYGLAALIAVAGIAISISSMVSGFGSLGSDLQQVVVPGNSDLSLSQIGEYTIFYENQTVINGRVYFTDEDIPGLQIEVKNKTTGQEVATYPPEGSMSYSFGSRFGRSVLAFNIDRPGIYELSAGYPQGGEGPEVVLAVGHGLFGSILSVILYPLVIFFGSIAAAAAIVIVTYLKRQEASKRAEEEERMIRGVRCPYGP